MTDMKFLNISSLMIFMILFSFSILSCQDNVQRLSPVINSKCKIRYIDNYIELQFDSCQYLFAKKNGEYYLSDDKKILVMSNNRSGRFVTKKYSINIGKGSSNIFYSKISDGHHVCVIHYDEKYKINKFETMGYVQYGEISDVPVSFEMDSTIAYRIGGTMDMQSPACE